MKMTQCPGVVMHTHNLSTLWGVERGIVMNSG